MIAELLIEALSGIVGDIEYTSEYCYSSEKSLKDTSVLVISQSGRKTVDTLAALRKAKVCGYSTFAVTNVPDQRWHGMQQSPARRSRAGSVRYLQPS